MIRLYLAGIGGRIVATNTAEQMLVATGAALALASLPRGRVAVWATLAGAGAAIFAWGIYRAHGGPIAAGGALALVNFVRLALNGFQRRSVRLSDEERAMAERCFDSLSRPALRQLLDMGLWIDGRVGETLIREGMPVSHLFYLSAGAADVLSGERLLTIVDPGHFLGELTVLDGNPATATVRLRSEARFWCIPAEALRRFVAFNPAFGPAVNAAFASDLRDKLRAATKALAGVG